MSFMKKLALTLFLLFPFTLILAQHKEELKGKVLDAKSRLPIEAAVVRVLGTNIFITTDPEGLFSMYPQKSESFEIEITYSGFITQRLAIESIAANSVDLGAILLEEDFASIEQLGLIALTENELEEENLNSETSARLLQATKDAFQQAAAYAWSQSFYRLRGLDNGYGKTLINGIVMDKLYNGRPQWSNWGGLNDAMRNQTSSLGSSPSSDTFGGILGTQSISTRASHLRKGTRIGFSGANTNYNWRPFFSHSSGLQPNNWAYSISGSYRGAKEGYWQGTNYDALSFFIAVERKINEKHSFNLSVIYAKNKRAKNSSNTTEQTDLKGHTYNSYWGWQEGKKRNARYKEINEPLLMLTHYWNFGGRRNLTTTVGYQLGYLANSRLDYQDNLNPDPAYYKNLPSYYLNQIELQYWQMPPEAFNALPNDDPFKIATLGSLAQANEAQIHFAQGGQINWSDIYKKNKSFNEQSKIILYEDRQEDQIFSFNTTFNASLTDHITLDIGVNYRKLTSSNFKKVIDLLGGSYYKDIDTFEPLPFQDSDLNHPNRSVYVGDKYGYNYSIFSDVLDVFTQFVFTYNQFDFYVAERLNYTSYQRDGLYKNPLYATQSLGKSEPITFNTIGLKGGFTYYISGKHLVQSSIAYYNQAPSIQNTFINPRINNTILPQLKQETIFSIDGSYRFRSSRLQTRLTGYFTEIRNSSQINFYYTEGIAISDAKGAFVAEIITPIHKRHIGLEWGAAYQLTPTIKINTATSLGQAYYDNNPLLYLSNNTLRKPLDYGQTRLNRYKVSNGPQTALSLGIEYKAPAFWFINATLNYFADAYVSVSALKRTENFILDPEKSHHPFDTLTADELRRILKQEKLPAFPLLSISGGKSWRLHNRSILGLLISLQNLLQVSYRTGGFEQARNATYAQEAERTKNNHTLFGNKYWYGYGRNFFFQAYYNF